ncbi:MAG: hypothetical protein AAGK21_01615 [Bacteroidota bacterium]
MRKLMTIEAVFPIAGRGILAAPPLPFGSGRTATDGRAEIRRPDGTTRRAELHIETEHVNHRGRSEHPRWHRVCRLCGIGPSEVPVGSEVWCTDGIAADLLDHDGA